MEKILNKRKIREILDEMEEVYSKAQYIRKERRLRKYKGSNSWVWEKIECRSKITREVGYNGRKKL